MKMYVDVSSLEFSTKLPLDGHNVTEIFSNNYLITKIMKFMGWCTKFLETVKQTESNITRISELPEEK
jgi:hypothetical protein